MLGALGESYGNKERWSISTSWRYFKSDRHYVGSEYQGERDEEGSQVINHINMAEVSLRWNIDDRWSLTTSVPYFMNDRSNPLRDGNGDVVARSETEANGLGDIMVVGRRWMLNPANHPHTNWIFGFGVKLPTGQEDVKDWRTRLSNGVETRSYEEVDQSIQPGDGGLGWLLDASWFYAMGDQGHVTWYASASYLFNPKETNGVKTNRGRPAEAIMSVGDQYLARIGLTFSGPNWHGWSFSVGGRLEGMPVRDVIGGDLGFRRPGYTIAVEPSFAWSNAKNTVAVSVPLIQYRNRTRSVPDRLTDRHGDAAFADWVAMVTYQRRFGKAIAPSGVEATRGPSEAEQAAWDRRPEFDMALCRDEQFIEKMDRFVEGLHGTR